MYKVLTADTGHVIYHSLLRPTNTDDVNLCASMFAGEPSTHNEVVKSRTSPSHIMDESKPADTVTPSPVFNPKDLIGRPFLMDEQPDGQRPRARIIQLLEDHESKLEDNPTRIKFKCSLNNDQQENVTSPLDKGDHPELDTSELCNEEQISQY
jgi:hypothetical protein